MSASRLLLFASALWLALSGAANAGTFNLIATLQVGSVSGFDLGYTVTGAATGVVSEGGGVAQIPAGLFPFTLTGPVSPAQSGVNAFTVVGGGLPAGTLDAGAATNILPLQGLIKLKAGANPVGSMPQSPIGGGGTATGMAIVFTPILSGQPWQLGTHTVTGTGVVSGVTAMFTGFDLRTVLGLGVVQFVAPQTITISTIPVTVPSGSVLTLNYVPVAEPGALSLLAATAAGMASLRVRGRRGRREA